MTVIEKDIVADSRSQQVLSELTQILYYQPLIIIMLCQVIGVLVLVGYFWEIVPHTELISWSVYMNLLSTTFIFTTLLYRTSPPARRNQQNWLSLLLWAGILLGMGWGSIILWSNIMQEESSILFVSLFAGGFSAAGIGILGPYLRSFVFYASFIILPFALVFFLQENQLYFFMGIMMLVFLVVITLTAYNMKVAVRKSIELRLENLDLVNDLVEKNNLAELARENAQLADISKSKFLAAASHDLRQPLHAIGLFVGALESRIQLPEVRSIIDNIRISTDALGDLLNSLLDISKLDAGVVEPQISKFQLQPIFKRIQNDFSEQACAKSLQLRIVNTEYSVESDPAMLESILLNLVSNAIRYTQQGKVLLGCRWHGNTISIEVHDSGIGIAEQEIDHIFEEFYQVKNPERDRSKGLGLGLAIVKRQAALLVCPIGIESTEKKGTVFRIRVPRVDAEWSAPTRLAHFVNDLKGIRVLVIDDESMIRVAMREILEKWHCQVFDAESAEQALNQFADDDCKLDIILSDYRLREGKTGIDAIHQIQHRCGLNIPAIILTGDTDPQRLGEAKNSGFKLLHKPVSPSKMRSLMSYLLDQTNKVTQNLI